MSMVESGWGNVCERVEWGAFAADGGVDVTLGVTSRGVTLSKNEKVGPGSAPVSWESSEVVMTKICNIAKFPTMVVDSGQQT
jgi:hypothetical protein